MALTPLDKEQIKREKAEALLALAATAGARHGACLTPGELASLVDKTLVKEKREKLWQHLSTCNQCYAAWLLLLQDRGKEKKRGRLFFFNKSTSIRIISTFLAAAACIALYLNVVRLDEMAVAPTVQKPVVTPQESSRVASPPPEGPAGRVSEGVGENEGKDALQAPSPSARVLQATPKPSAVEKHKVKQQKQEKQPEKRQEVNDQQRKIDTVASPELQPGPAMPGKEDAGAGHAKPAPAQATMPAAKGELQSAPAEEAATASGKEISADKEIERPRSATPSPKMSVGGAVASGKTDEIVQWLDELQRACSNQKFDPAYWSIQIKRGGYFQSQAKLLGDAEVSRKLKAVMPLVQAISDTVSASEQCRLILVELAEERTDQREQ